MIGLAVMAWLTVLICYGGNWVLGQCMIERPLVVGLVAGLLMGDVKTGVIIGASLEAIHHAGRSRWRRHRVPLDLHEQRVPRFLRRHL